MNCEHKKKKQCFDDPTCFLVKVASGLQSQVEVTEALSRVEIREALIHSALKITKGKNIISTKENLYK
jgi:hypothetical protein